MANKKQQQPISDEKEALKDKRKMIGKLGEGYAVEQLIIAGYEIIDLNWKCKTGEIDIIAQIGQQIVFVEVRTRSIKGSFGTPQESVNYRKQMKVRATANVYLYQHKQYHVPIRFDVIAVYLNPDGSLLELNLISNAF